MCFQKQAAFSASLVCFLALAMGGASGKTWPDKSAYDVDISGNPALAKSKTAFSGSLINTGHLEASLLPGGYFTLGTINGKSVSTLDDHCPLLFGHPFAKTSYPLIKINGVWGKIEKFLAVEKCSIVSTATSTQMNCSIPQDSLDFTFSLLFPASQSDIVNITVVIKNNSSASKNVQAAIVMDPAMGTQSGDACALVNNVPIAQESASTAADSLVLVEKSGGLQGLKMSCTTSAAQLLKTVFANWSSIIKSDSLNNPQSPGATLYDLCIKQIFTARDIAPGETYTAVLSISLLDPDFGKSIFVRWEAPRSFSIQNGGLFPQTPQTRLMVYNATSTAAQCTVKTIALSIGTSDSTPCVITVPALDYAYKIIPVTIFEHYKTDFTSAMTVQAVTSGQSADAVNFPVHIPASPYSDTGLSVVIDSFFLTGATRNVTFSVKKKADSTYVLDLSKTNLFMYENGVSPLDFGLGKDTTKGVSAVDIVFVLDVTGSMTDEIAGVQNNIVQFADALSKKGIDFRLGMVTFLDYVENVYALTNNVQTFQGYVRAQSAHAGDDEPENSLKALDTAAQMAFRPNAKVKFIWITDAPYHTQGDGTPFTSLTVKPVLDRLLSKGITVFSIGPASYQTDWYMPLYDPTGGQFYNIYGNFQDILLDIANMNSSKNYLVSYNLSSAFSADHAIVIEIHAHGLGGKDTTGGSGGLAKKTAGDRNGLQVDYKAGKRELLISSANYSFPVVVTMCDLRGKTVLSEKLSPQEFSHPIALTRFRRIGTGVYLVTISSLDHRSSAKVSITRRINIL
jgi:hypothetical protein